MGRLRSGGPEARPPLPLSRVGFALPGDSCSLQSCAFFLLSLPLPTWQHLARQKERIKPAENRVKPAENRKSRDCLGKTVATTRAGNQNSRVRAWAATSGLPRPRPHAAWRARSSAFTLIRMRNAGRARHRAQAHFEGRAFRWLLSRQGAQVGAGRLLFSARPAG